MDNINLQAFVIPNSLALLMEKAASVFADMDELVSRSNGRFTYQTTGGFVELEDNQEKQKPKRQKICLRLETNLMCRDEDGQEKPLVITIEDFKNRGISMDSFSVSASPSSCLSRWNVKDGISKILAEKKLIPQRGQTAIDVAKSLPSLVSLAESFLQSLSELTRRSEGRFTYEITGRFVQDKTYCGAKFSDPCLHITTNVPCTDHQGQEKMGTIDIELDYDYEERITIQAPLFGPARFYEQASVLRAVTQTLIGKGLIPG
ncbi:MAG: hypothetical protein SFW62_08770 [Alphaproteobacteria bacterium]|nr:hypothetical protein [Alphaproteobacteria bacterium]